jgi:Short repeat of unknown function (DUF308)
VHNELAIGISLRDKGHVRNEVKAMTMKFNQATVTALAHDWWIFLVRGIAAVLFGFLAFIWPHITLLVLVLLFGIYAVVDGVLSLARAFGAGQRWQSWVWPLIGGLAGIAAGVAAFVWPGMTALVLLYIIAAWAVVTRDMRDHRRRCVAPGDQQRVAADSRGRHLTALWPARVYTPRRQRLGAGLADWVLRDCAWRGADRAGVPLARLATA